MTKEETMTKSGEEVNESSKKRPAVTPITSEGDMPQKKFYRQRAHCNPLSHNDAFEYPRTPQDMDWTEEHYPEPPAGNSLQPTVLDIGCGFGGLTIALATLLPKETVLGMEIRAKVTEYVRLRILASRKENPGSFQNCSVMRTNSMKFLPHYFKPHSLSKIFFCFPDPHFKRKNHGRRIVSERLLSEYAHFLKIGGRLYCITDVKELHDWHVEKCNAHPLFRRLDDEQVFKEDPCVHAMSVETEESKKVERNKGSKHYAVYERIDDSEAPSLDAESFFD
ncbi:unnamed protein product [Cylindrotheca closterium]|uniref:tRNA (guanine-N(7)-)-methyltransferase n=1 Tax=Cylindrotheca closterium TaxID=2856 RepID=A0AAD2GA55_9STRA|nr:unnamed protein product [Cylindrotheca closterium]